MAQPKKTAAAASEKPMIDQIIAGAERAFLDAGYELTTMDSVARHADVARGSVYNHFSSKEELFLAVMRRGTAEFVERSLRHDAESKPPVERLRSVAVHFLRAATESVSVEMYRTVVTQAERLPELSALFYSQGLQAIEMKFRGILTLMASDLNEEPALAADHLLSLLMGGFFSRRLLRAPRHPADMSLETYVDRAIASLLKRV
jgi:TetR/AcrR family transcriptional repressor of mexJK operon